MVGKPEVGKKGFEEISGDVREPDFWPRRQSQERGGEKAPAMLLISHSAKVLANDSAALQDTVQECIVFDRFELAFERKQNPICWEC